MTNPVLTDFDLHLIAEGTHFRTYEKLGAHPRVSNGVRRSLILRLGAECGTSFCDRRFQ